jgi:hypothetical protein
MKARRSRRFVAAPIVVALLWIGTALFGRLPCLAASKGSGASTTSVIPFPLFVFVSYRHDCGPECGHFGRELFLWLPGHPMSLWRYDVKI